MTTTTSNNLIKGMFMTLISFVCALMASGLPTTNLSWEISGLTLLGTLIGYFAQNVALPSNISVLGTINVGATVFKGLLVALGGGLASLAAAGLTATSADWGVIGKLMLGLLVGYIGKQFATNSNGTPLTPEPKN